MAETNGEAGKRKVMVTGGTGLVGSGIQEFVSTDKEVRTSSAVGPTEQTVVAVLMASLQMLCRRSAQAVFQLCFGTL